MIGEAQRERRARKCCSTAEGSRIWCNNDCCGVVCAFITWGLLLYAQYVITFHILVPWLKNSPMGRFHTVLFNLVAVLALSSHMRAMLTDPGAVPSKAAAPLSDMEEARTGEDGAQTAGRPESQEQNPRRWCRKCSAYKPVRAHHCSVCQRCIVRMDHHCPWLNNCVGIANHKLFLLFIGYVFLLSVYALGLVLARFMSCIGQEDGCGNPDGHLLVMFLLVEAMLFGMFTVCMLCDQWTVVTTNQTQIDRLKGEAHTTPRAEFNEVFGGQRCRLSWVLPTRASFPRHMWEEIMGYRLKDDDGMELGPYKFSQPSAAKVALEAPGGQHSALRSTDTSSSYMRGRKAANVEGQRLLDPSPPVP